MNKIATCCLAIVTALGSASASHAQFFDGGEIYKSCLEGSNACTGFLAAVADVANISSDMVSPIAVVCIPVGSTTKDLERAFVSYIKDNQSIEYFPASYLAILAFKSAWHCPTS